MRTLGHWYLAKLRELDPTAQRITDKLPYNFWTIPLIHKLLPGAQIVFCRRHPLDVCLSCYFQNFSTGHEYTFDLASLGHFYNEFARVMRTWCESLQIPMHTVDYESLVTDPQTEVRQLLAYCRLPWEEACLDYHRSKRTVGTASYQQVRKPLYQRSVRRWEHYVSHIGPLLKTIDLPEDLAQGVRRQLGRVSSD